MDSISNFLSNSISNIDKSVTGILENKYLFITIVVITLLMGSLAQSRLTYNILSLFDTPLSRMLMIAFIYYISQKNIPLAILMLTATVVLMNTQSKQRFNIMLISLFRGSIFDRRQKRMDKAEMDRKLNRMLRRISKVLNDMKKNKTKKIPKDLTKLAIKAKTLAKTMGKTTPKIVKDLIPSNIIDKLLKDKKISSEDADKLKTIKSNSLLELIKLPEIIKLSETSPKKTVVKTEVLTPTVVTSEKFDTY